MGDHRPISAIVQNETGKGWQKIEQNCHVGKIATQRSKLARKHLSCLNRRTWSRRPGHWFSVFQTLMMKRYGLRPLNYLNSQKNLFSISSQCHLKIRQTNCSVWTSKSCHYQEFPLNKNQMWRVHIIKNSMLQMNTLLTLKFLLQIIEERFHLICSVPLQSSVEGWWRYKSWTYIKFETHQWLPFITRTICKTHTTNFAKKVFADCLAFPMEGFCLNQRHALHGLFSQRSDQLRDEECIWLAQPACPIQASL